jgi:WbqC-like protein family
MPWAGYFLKMAACDVFVFHDNVQITKAGPTRRVKIAARHTIDNTQWLTVPLKKHSDFALIKDLEVSWESDWTKKHLNQIKDAYSQCPYYHHYFTKISHWYQGAIEFSSLSEMNMYFIRQLMIELNITKDLISSSQLPMVGKAAAYNLSITQHLGGSYYLSGKGGDKYQDEGVFRANQIDLLKLDAKNYLEQQFSDYNINYRLSIIEMLMKVDIDTIKSGFSTIKV